MHEPSAQGDVKSGLHVSYHLLIDWPMGLKRRLINNLKLKSFKRTNQRGKEGRGVGGTSYRFLQVS